MKVNTIEWHENNLENFQATLNRKQEELNKLQKKVERMHLEASFRRYQIWEAKEEGKTSFDPSRYKKAACPDGVTL